MSAVGLRLSAALQAKVSTRVLLALSRFAPRLKTLAVRLAQAPNPLGGIDQSCRIRAVLSPRERIQVESTNGTLEAATARAAEQLARRVANALLDGGVRGELPFALPGAARPATGARRRSRTAPAADGRPPRRRGSRA